MPQFVYNATGAQRSFNFQKGLFYYLNITLSNCIWNGNVFDSNIENLETTLVTTFSNITNLEFRGVGCSMVRGTGTDSLTLGVAAGYYSTKTNLTEVEAIELRAAVNDALTSVSGLTVSEVRVETTLIQKSTF